MSRREPQTQASGQAPHTPVATTGCENCREQHLKCDRVIPTCGRCDAAGRPCVRTGIKVRLTKRPFPQKQKWTKTPRRLVFINETMLVATEAQSQSGETYDDEDLTLDDHAAASDESDLPRPLPVVDTSVDSAPLLAPASPTDRFFFQGTEANAHRRSFHSPAQQHSADLDSYRPQIYLSTPVWPLPDPREALLFRHFVHKLAIWLDLCDPLQSFETIVPQRAATCPILLNAIFALSARHMSHISDYDPLASNRYHEECLKYLIPVLNHAATVSDENLFAATIILRVLEEMEVKNMGTDNHGYLLGIHAFVKDGDRYLLPGTLSAASFWVGLRQEIYSAVMNHEPVRINLIHSLVDRSLNPSDDYTWSNRAVIHCADVLNFCFGEDTGLAAVRWAELDDWNRRWRQAAPASFIPIFEKEGAADAFPEFWYHSGCHAIGAQHHLLAELFLVRFNPNVPRVGGHRMAAERQTTQRIQELVRRICGIGLGNQYTPPSMFTACMAIAAFGDHFPEKQDQEAMLSILKKTEEYHARPTEAVQHQIVNVFK